MKLSLKLKKTSHYRKKINQLRKQLESLNESKVYVGYFTDQGIHEESGMLYTELMTIHEYGVDKNGVSIPARPVMELTQSGGVFTSEDKSAIREAFRGVFAKGIPISKPLNSIGEYYREKGYQIFGSTALLETVKGNPPLIETGDLSDKFSYRTSLTYRIN